MIALLFTNILILTVSLSQNVSMGETVCSGNGARTADLGRDPAAWCTDWTEDWVTTG